MYKTILKICIRTCASLRHVFKALLYLNILFIYLLFYFLTVILTPRLLVADKIFLHCTRDALPERGVVEIISKIAPRRSSADIP